MLGWRWIDLFGSARGADVDAAIRGELTRTNLFALQEPAR
jgi:hypothetical protein